MASTFFGVNAGVVPPGSPVEIGVFVNTEGETVNAVAGDVIVPEGAQAKIMNGDSLVSLWVVPPTLSGKRIHFEGVIPGGVTSSQLPLFSVVLTPSTSGDLLVSTENVKVYKHDGQGTVLPVTNGTLKLVVAADATPAPVRGEDTTPPEAFTPIIVSDPNIAGGKRAVVFATTDTSSGVDHYEVRETGFLPASSWVVAQSPFVLSSGGLKKTVEVRAIDRAGNIRTASVSRPLDSSSVALLGGCILFLVVVALLFAALYRRRLWRKRSRSRAR
jgi:hypothetical protein